MVNHMVLSREWLPRQCCHANGYESDLMAAHIIQVSDTHEGFSEHRYVEILSPLTSNLMVIFDNTQT